MKPTSGNTDVLRDGLASRGAAPPRLPALAVAAVIPPPQDTKRCCCPSACSRAFGFGFGWRRNVLNVVSFFFHCSLAQQVQHPRGWRRLCRSMGAGAVRALPGIDGSKRPAGPRLGSNGCWRGAGGGCGGGVPRARAPTGPSITRASSRHGGCGCPTSPRGRAGDDAAPRMFVNIELWTVFGKMNC